MSFSYANPTVGSGAGGIGWFDFGNAGYIGIMGNAPHAMQIITWQFPR